MVSTVPDAVARVAVDTLVLAHRLRGTFYPAGCNLSDLVWENLGPAPQATLPGQVGARAAWHRRSPRRCPSRGQAMGECAAQPTAGVGSGRVDEASAKR
jgi:hypothetical protein